MAKPIPFTPATEQLGHSAALEHRARFPLLGLPLEIQSNSPAVIEAAQRSFGQWSELAPDLVAPIAPLLVKLVVHAAEPADHALGSTPRFIQRMHGNCFLAAAGSNLLMAHRDEGVALGFVTPELVAEDLHFRYNVLECLALLLASHRDRTPVHAAALVSNGRAVLLVGRSTAGKSTLCYAAVRDGFQLLAEDVVYVSSTSGLRVWGNPGPIYLLADAPRHFPELAEITPQIQANGKHKLAINAAALGTGRQCRFADSALACLIERGDRAGSILQPIEQQLLVDTICQAPEAGFDLDARMREVLAALAAGGAYRLIAGSDLAGAVALLKELTDQGSG